MAPEPPVDGISYVGAGVDVAAYNAMLARVRSTIEATHGSSVASGIGPFAGLYRLPGGAGHLAASADGVGTKIKVAIAAGSHRGIGRDLVNHCVNDIATAGARPLFFLDYFATGKLEEAVFTEVVEGLADACREAGCALLGGETAEMPGVYALGDYDLAGFVVGLVEPGALPDPASVRVGDVVLGIPAAGIHTNGFSLVRRVFQDVPLDVIFPELGAPLGEVLLTGHRSYLKELETSRKGWKVAAHITGGGLFGNIPRCLPDGLAARLVPRWPVPPVFDLIARRGGVAREEMFATFNMGIGMVLVCSPLWADRLAGAGVLRIGEVVEQSGPGRVALA